MVKVSQKVFTGFVGINYVLASITAVWVLGNSMSLIYRCWVETAH